MAGTNPTRRSPVSAAAAAFGLLLLAYGVSGLIFGGSDFGTNTGGTVDGETWLGLEGNGWTNALCAAAGGLLILGSPTRAGAATAMVVTALAFGAGAIIAVFDGDDVFGIFAANGWTMLAWGVTAIVLLAAALLPAMRPRDADTTVAGPPRDQAARDEALERDLQRPRGRMR
jgi:hypothetical protein